MGHPLDHVAVRFELARHKTVNDAGQQVEKLALSVDARVNEALGRDWEIPEGGYRGDYLKDVAAGLLEERPDVGDAPTEARLAWLKRRAIAAIVDFT